MLVVVIKGTLFCPSPANRCTSSMSKCGSSWLTIFTGEPGFSAPVYEIDYGPRQPACDVLLVGSAHATRASAMLKVLDTVR